MITPEDIDAKMFATTRLRAGYDPDEVDHYLDLVITDYRAALARAHEARQAIAQHVCPTVYSDMDKLLSVAQQAADRTVAEANDRARDIVADAQRKASAIVDSGHAERHSVIGKLESQRGELEQSIGLLSSARDALTHKLKHTLAGLEDG